MKRIQKYPETETFHYHNANPKGRIGGDCVIRAIAVFLGITWEQCFREMTEVALKHYALVDEPKTYVAYLQEKGFAKMPQPRKADNTKYTGKEFCEEIAKDGKRYVVSMANHLSLVFNKKIWDIWDCTGKTVGNYWVK